jgi:hypothetical protein
MRQMSEEEWRALALQIESRLCGMEGEIESLRSLLRSAGIPVRRQRIRITGENGKAQEALDVLRAHGGTLRPSTVAGLLRVSREYAFDLLASLVAANTAERVGRGQYRAKNP